MTVPTTQPRNGQSSDVAIEIRSLDVSLSGRQILHGIDLQVPTGTWLGLVGPNGAGKSTLVRAMLGLIPASGSIRLMGDSLDSMSQRQRAGMIGYAPQSPAVPDISVRDYVMLGRTPHVSLLRRPSAHDRAQVAECLDALDLNDLATRQITQLSGGERQRAVLARALAQEARILVLDEPTSALDLGHAQQVLELLDKLRRDRGLTVISSIHDLTLAAQYTDEVLVLDHGRVVAQGPGGKVITRELLRDHYGAHAVVRCEAGSLSVWVQPLRSDEPMPASLMAETVGAMDVADLLPSAAHPGPAEVS